MKTRLARDRNENVVERTDYIAKTRGTREFPWRVLVIASDDRTLSETDIVHESPLQMRADAPSNYLRELEGLEFISAVPTVWDETRVLDAKIGEYILLASRQGKNWYVGAMTNWTARDLEVDLSFLGGGAFQADIFMDGPNAERVGVDYRREQQAMTGMARIKVHLAPGGGWAARITPR